MKAFSKYSSQSSMRRLRPGILSAAISFELSPHLLILIVRDGDLVG